MLTIVIFIPRIFIKITGAKIKQKFHIRKYFFYPLFLSAKRKFDVVNDTNDTIFLIFIET
jgi:hypothetical protein